MPKVFSQTDSKGYYSGIGIQDAGLSPGPTGLDKRYQALYDANPYRSLTYNRSGWQALMSALGFRTDYDRWSEEAQVNAAEYDAQIAQMQMQNEYNSPEEQASRMREAGLNPDLLGTQGVSDASSPVQDVNGMSPNVGNEADNVLMPVIGTFVSHVMDSVGKGFMFAKDIIQMSRAFDTQDIDNLSKINSLADSYLRSRVSSSDLTNDLSFEGRRNFLQIPEGQFSTVARDYGIPRRYRRVFERAVNDRAWSISLENDLWSQVVSRNRSKSEFAKQSVSSSENGDIEVMKSFWKPIVADLDEIKHIKAKFDKQMENLREGQLNNLGIKQDLEGQYLDTMYESDAGKARAGAEQSDYWVRFYKNSVQKILNQTSYKITKNLQDQADRGSTFAQGCLLAWSLSDMLDFGLSDIFDLAGTIFSPFKSVLKGFGKGKGFGLDVPTLKK